MRTLGRETLSLDVFEAHKENRVKGESLEEAQRSEGYSLVIAYEQSARKFDVVLTFVGKPAPSGRRFMRLKATEPHTGEDILLDLKSSRGVVSRRQLEGSALEYFDESAPQAAVIYKEEDLDPDSEAKFMGKDEACFYHDWVKNGGQPGKIRQYARLAMLGVASVAPH